MLGNGVGLPADYAELQLRFARRAVMLGTHDFADAVTQLTNLHRRFGLGTPTDTPNQSWLHYLDGLVACTDLHRQVRWTTEFAASRDGLGPPSSAVARVGPFSVHVEGDRLRTHFTPETSTLRSPLQATVITIRRQEFRSALAAAFESHPQAQRIRGSSWLYSTTSYRSVFPPSHVSSATVHTGAHRFQGSSAWGQFLDHRGGVKPALSAQFVAAVDAFDGSEPWKLFPIPTLIVDSPIEVFELDRAVALRQPLGTVRSPRS